MKAVRNKRGISQKTRNVNFTVNDDLNKYRGPEFEPPKLKLVKENLASQ